MTTHATANQYYATSLAKMGLVKEVIAAEDICDANGNKLWAKGKAIDARLWEKLSNRALKQPLETTVSTADPLDHEDIAEAIQRLLDTKPHFKTLVAPKIDPILARIKVADFNSAELVMLSLLRHGERDIFDHACAVAAAAMCFGVHADLPPADMDRLLHAGMLHDVGEMYLEPGLFGRRELSIADQRELLMHPALGAMVTREVLRRNSNIFHAIEQSHERLDGSGYASGLPGNALTSLALPLLTAEAIIGLLMADSAGIQHAAIALRLNPGEFPAPLVALINGLARETSTAGGATTQLEPALRERMASATSRNDQADTMLARILRDGPLSPAQRTVMVRAQKIVQRCARTLNSTGLAQLGSLSDEADLAIDRAEAEATTREIEYRLGALIRDIEVGFLGQRKPDAVEELLKAIAPRRDPAKAGPK